jgi:hypothetical protein
MTDKPQPPSDKELFSILASRLLTLPDEIRRTEAGQVKLGNDLATWKVSLKDAETDCAINAPGGKNDDERKKALASALSASPAVKQARSRILELECAVAAQDVDVDALKRQWQASIALAELQAARLNALAKIQTAETMKKEIKHD